jgi:hypothetical protein
MKHDGRISLSMGQTDSQVMFGFGNKDISQPYHCMFANNGVIVVIEGSKTTASLGKYTTEDVLINSRNNSVVVTYLSSCFIQTNAFNILDSKQTISRVRSILQHVSNRST